MTIPVTVLIVTKNEEQRIGACLDAVEGFEQIIVIDSQSRDRTKELALERGATVVDFSWNGQYPKKRQWVLETIPFVTEWILWIDADEIMTTELKNEISALFENGPEHDGYFIKGRYCIGADELRFGIKNSKLVLFKPQRFYFPAVDDLDIPGMGEIEGHYQPLPREEDARIGSLKHVMIHRAYDDVRAWIFRHEKYARWEAGMNVRDAWPSDPVAWRQSLKAGLRRTRFRPQVMFLASYMLKLGFLDGSKGLFLAQSRYQYYKTIRRLEQTLPAQKKTGTHSS